MINTGGGVISCIKWVDIGIIVLCCDGIRYTNVRKMSSRYMMGIAMSGMMWMIMARKW